MKQQKIYIDTSVVGGFFDAEFENATKMLFERLASWNFKHIVNLARIRGYNAVNLKNGYTTIEIRNPKELIDYGKRI